jgi:hypothetical protein
LGEANQTQLLFLGVLILLLLLAFFVFFILAIFVQRARPNLSPYSGLPLRYGADLSYAAKEKILRALFDLKAYDNRIFDLNRAAVCRETGRIFPEALNLFSQIKVDWDFLKKRFPGDYVSWGSLSEEQKLEVLSHHGEVKGYQMERSSKEASPRLVEPEFAFLKPGPLYVDFEKKHLLGWKEVPQTEFEILIVQKPIK